MSQTRPSVDWSKFDWDAFNKECRHLPSEEFMVSCGTVTLHRVGSDHPKVLIVFNKRIGAFQIPKGRLNLGEDHRACAMRETYEETGIAVRPLPLVFGTRSTPSESKRNGESSVLCPEKDKLSRVPNKEAIHMCTYGDPETGATRFIFWYAAQPVEELPEGRDHEETFDVFWMTEAEAVQKLTIDAEVGAVKRTFECWRHTQDLVSDGFDAGW